MRKGVKGKAAHYARMIENVSRLDRGRTSIVKCAASVNAQGGFNEALTRAAWLLRTEPKGLDPRTRRARVSNCPDWVRWQP